MRSHEDSLLHKTHTDELQESAAVASPEAQSAPDAENVVKKKRRRRARRRKKNGANGAVASTTSEATASPPENGGNGTAAPRPEVQPGRAKPNGRKRRGSENGQRGNGSRRLDIGSWRAEPPGERMRRRPGQAQTQSPQLWAAWSAVYFGKRNEDSE